MNRSAKEEQKLTTVFGRVKTLRWDLVVGGSEVLVIVAIKVIARREKLSVSTGPQVRERRRRSGSSDRGSQGSKETGKGSCCEEEAHGSEGFVVFGVKKEKSMKKRAT